VAIETTAISIPVTVAELLARLPDIPAERIQLDPPPGTATEDDVVASKSRYSRLCELRNGVLVAKPAGWYESRLAAVLISRLDTFAKNHDLGFVLAPDAPIRVGPGQILLPDISFFSWGRFPNRILPAGAILGLTPDLAVEIKSPSNTKAEMEFKRAEYFAGGAALVWEVDAAHRTALVFTSPAHGNVVSESESLDGGSVLPGFALRLAEWFDEAGRRETTQPLSPSLPPARLDPSLPPAEWLDPVTEVYKRDVDRSLLRENLKLTVEERISKANALHASLTGWRGTGKPS